MSDLSKGFSDTVSAVAILNLFIDHEVPADGALELAWLEREWRRTGLRHADLIDGLQQLRAGGLLRLSSGDEDRCAILTSDGHRRCTGQFDSPDGLRQQLSALTVLLRVSRRRPSEMPGFGRRASDPPPQMQQANLHSLH